DATASSKVGAGPTRPSCRPVRNAERHRDEYQEDCQGDRHSPASLAKLYFVENVTGQPIKFCGGTQVKSRYQPSHQKLGKGKKISHGDCAEHTRSHQLGSVSHENRKDEVVQQKEHERGNDKQALDRQQVPKLTTRSNSIPFLRVQSQFFV